MKIESCLFWGGPYYLPILLSHYCSIDAWNNPGDVADEKLILLKSWTVISNFWDHINTDDVLAVPEPPIKRTPFCTKAVDEWIGLGWLRIVFVKNSTLKESSVGSKSWENLTALSAAGFHNYGLTMQYSIFWSWKTI